MENFVSDYILGFCDYLDKTGDYEFADRIMSTLANPYQKNVKIASKQLYSQEEVLQKLISYRLAADEVSPSIIRDIEGIGKTPKTPGGSSGEKALWARFVSMLMSKFPAFANSLSKFKNFGGPVVAAIFTVPQAVYWIKKIVNEGWEEAFDSKKEVAEFVSALSALLGTGSAFAAVASAAPTAGLGGLTFAALTNILFGISAAAYALTWILPNDDDPYDKLPADKKPKPQNSSPAAPREKPAPERSKPSEEPSESPSRPSSRPSRPRTPNVDPKEQRTIDDLREIQKGMGSISF